MKRKILLISIILLKILNRFHVLKYFKYIPYYIMQTWVCPTKKRLTFDEAEKNLSEIHPDVKTSAICSNKILKPSRYDLQVIIPVFNTEKYLDKCITSVLSQNTKYSFHLVIVNDGSTDNSERILKKYENDNRITIISQKNTGLSGARNTALSTIYARYITFLDSDDLFAPDAIENLLNSAFKYDADIVEGSYMRRRDDGTLFGGEIIIDEGPCTIEKLKGYPWMKVIKAEMFEKIHFPLGYWFEDTIMGMLLFPMAKIVTHIKEVVYYYTYNTNSISFSSVNSSKSIDGIYITRALLRDAKNNGALDSAPEYQYHHFLQQIRNNWARSIMLGPDVEMAMFYISCSLWEEYFSEKFNCKKNKLKRMELALKNKDFKLFRKTCFIDF